MSNSNTLSEMWYKYNLLSDFKKGLNQYGWVGKDLFILQEQINLLKDLIEIESKNVLSEMLTRKTYYRLLVKINKGIENLVDIVENPEFYVLNQIDNDKEAWISDDALIFQIKKGDCAVFGKKSRKCEGFTYTDNKWQ